MNSTTNQAMPDATPPDHGSISDRVTHFARVIAEAALGFIERLEREAGKEG